MKGILLAVLAASLFLGTEARRFKDELTNKALRNTKRVQ
jgi:hypothetical protein